MHQHKHASPSCPITHKKQSLAAHAASAYRSEGPCGPPIPHSAAAKARRTPCCCWCCNRGLNFTHTSSQASVQTCHALVHHQQTPQKQQVRVAYKHHPHQQSSFCADMPRIGTPSINTAKAASTCGRTNMSPYLGTTGPKIHMPAATTHPVLTVMDVTCQAQVTRMGACACSSDDIPGQYGLTQQSTAHMQLPQCQQDPCLTCHMTDFTFVIADQQEADPAPSWFNRPDDAMLAEITSSTVHPTASPLAVSAGTLSIGCHHTDLSQAQQTQVTGTHHMILVAATSCPHDGGTHYR